MNHFRLREVSIIPQYAMSALNPTGRSAAWPATCSSPGASASTPSSRSSSAASPWWAYRKTSWSRYPFELSGGMRQRVTMVISTLLNPSLADRRRGDFGPGRVHPTGGGRDADEFRDRGFVKSMIVITHDLSHPGPDRRHDPHHVPGQARREGERGHDHPAPAATLHPAARWRRCPKSASRYEDTALTGSRAPPSLAPPAYRVPIPGPLPLAFDKCAEDPPFIELSPGHQVACWKADEEVASERRRAGPGGR